MVYPNGPESNEVKIVQYMYVVKKFNQFKFQWNKKENSDILKECRFEFLK